MEGRAPIVLDSSMGLISKVDLYNPLKIKVWFLDFNSLVVLDNFLNEITRINFNEIPSLGEIYDISSWRKFFVWSSWLMITTTSVLVWTFGRGGRSRTAPLTPWRIFERCVRRSSTCVFENWVTTATTCVALPSGPPNGCVCSAFWARTVCCCPSCGLGCT